MSEEGKLIRVKSEPSLDDLYVELDFDLCELKAMASLIGQYNGNLSEEMLFAIQRILERIHDSMQEKCQVMGELQLCEIPRREGAK